METPITDSNPKKLLMLTEKEATDFFSDFYGGAHHIPGHKLHEFGYGWYVKHDRGELCTYDFNQLTRLVLMAHERAIRVCVAPHTFNTVKVIIHKRQQDGKYFERHPTIEKAIEDFHNSKTHHEQQPG